MSLYRLDVAADVARLKKEFANLSDREIKASAKASANKSLQEISKRWLKLVAGKSNIPQAVLKKRVSVLKASRRWPSGVIFFRKYPVKYSEIGVGKTLQKGGIRIGRHYEPSAFNATMPSGHEGVFMRKGESRLPIKEVAVEIKSIVDATGAGLRPELQNHFIHNFEADVKRRIQRNFK